MPNGLVLESKLGTNLDRLQIVKGWVDKDGKTQERVYDVAVSGGRKIDADGRFGTKPLPGTTMTLQERACTSPIWYAP